MSNLGDTPLYLFSQISNSLQNMIGAEALLMQAIFFLGIIVFIILYFKLDRGGIAFTIIVAMGVVFQLNLIGMEYFFIVIYNYDIIIFYLFVVKNITIDFVYNVLFVVFIS